MSSSKRKPADRTDLSGLSEEEKREFLKTRNTETARRNRKSWKESDAEIRELYDANEKKIRQLEKVADKLSKELKKDGSKKTKASERPQPAPGRK